MATRGRKKRARSRKAGTAVSVKPHVRTPRGANRGKPRVRVDAYRRAKSGGGSNTRRKKR